MQERGITTKIILTYLGVQDRVLRVRYRGQPVQGIVLPKLSKTSPCITVCKPIRLLQILYLMSGCNF